MCMNPLPSSAEKRVRMILEPDTARPEQRGIFAFNQVFPSIEEALSFRTGIFSKVPGRIEDLDGKILQVFEKTENNWGVFTI